MPPKPVVLCILDGWGHAAPGACNAVTLAEAPVWRRWISEAPHALIDASELHVGLPAGQMGNSEVGHMNLGAGRVVMQDLPRIDAAFASNHVGEIPAFHDFVATLKASGGACHPVRVHALLDGRDTPPRSAEGFVRDFLSAVEGGGDIRIATVGGRYYAMDRDKRWERVALA